MQIIKTAIAVMAITAALLTTATAQSKTDSTKTDSITTSKWGFGLGVEGLKSSSGLASNSWGIGVTPRLQYSLDKKFALTFTSGVYHFFTNTTIVTVDASSTKYRYVKDFQVVPVKVGLKGFLWTRVYLGVEVGAAFRVDEEAWSKPLAAPSIGYATKKWDFSARYENFSNKGYSISMFALRAAYGIGL